MTWGREKKKKGMRDSSGSTGETSVKNTPARKRETTQYNTNKLKQPWQIMAASMHNVDKLWLWFFSRYSEVIQLGRNDFQILGIKA